MQRRLGEILSSRTAHRVVWLFLLWLFASLGMAIHGKTLHHADVKATCVEDDDE